MMKLELIARYFSPVRQQFDSTTNTSYCNGLLRRDEVLAALGFVYSECEFGINLWFFKMGISSPDNAVSQLYQRSFSLRQDCLPLFSLGEKKQRNVLQILCLFAVQEYAKSAASRCECHYCEGKGYTEATVFTNKVSRQAIRPKKIIEGGPSSSKDVWRRVQEVVKTVCSYCGGKGTRHDSCQCQGRGVVLNRKSTKKFGVPVMSECGKCKGRGYARLTFSTVLNSLRSIWSISRSTAYKHLRPFYEMLVALCHKEEAYAESKLRAVFK
ncbi:antitermination protein [Serratia marcescens]|uniref:antitermination protein Q n=1 Tax=Serratia marcescens TaxID=615 RepID=UPI003204E406